MTHLPTVPYGAALAQGGPHRGASPVRAESAHQDPWAGMITPMTTTWLTAAVTAADDAVRTAAHQSGAELDAMGVAELSELGAWVGIDS